MLDLSQNLIIPAVVGPLVVFILGYAGWATRRLYVKHVEEIKNMAVTQKEIGEKLAGVLEREKELSSDLRSGMEKVDLKFENMGLTFNKDLGVLAANVDKDIQSLATNMDKDIQGLRHSFNEMKASVGAHDKVVDKDLAEIREWLKGDGTWPSRSNGKG